jgi:hypothetical protein
MIERFRVKEPEPTKTEQTVQVPPALKHGGYSGMTLLPGENATAFEKMHADLIAEWNPTGPCEDDIVATIARLIWRKQNLPTYRKADAAKARFAKIKHELVPRLQVQCSIGGMPSPEEVSAGERAAREKARKELGTAWEFVEAGDAVTIDHLLSELTVMDRLDGMIDRCIKRLLLARGCKSISASSATAPTPPKRLTAA